MSRIIKRPAVGPNHFERRISLYNFFPLYPVRKPHHLWRR
jgi:hypothetical protein